MEDARHRGGKKTRQQTFQRGTCNDGHQILFNFPYGCENLFRWLVHVAKWINDKMLLEGPASKRHMRQFSFQNNKNLFHRNTIPKKNPIIPRFTNVMKRQLQQLVEVTLTFVCSFRQTEKWGNRHDALSQLSHNEPETKWKSLLSLMGGKCVMLLRKSWVGNIMQQRGRGKKQNKTKQRTNYWDKYCTSLRKHPEFVESSYFFFVVEHFLVLLYGSLCDATGHCWNAVTEEVQFVVT